MIAPVLDAQWSSIQRIMGEVLIIDQQPSEICKQHQEILDAIAAGGVVVAENIEKNTVPARLAL
jgi:DNA-binding FadR family transcriptional regulator